ncbi:MAG: hypothetical protein Q9191_000043 [Dirinaria sp. TL-2023a]
MTESSRIFVRGLPPNIRSEELQDHFSKLSPITDLKCITRKRIAYIGYKLPADALKAVKYYNRSFINMTRINVELARSIEDQRMLQQHDTTADQNATTGVISAVQDATASENLRKRKRKASDSQVDSSLRNLEPSMRNRSSILDAAAVGKRESQPNSLDHDSTQHDCPPEVNGNNVYQDQDTQSKQRAPVDAEGQGTSGLAEAYVVQGPSQSLEASARSTKLETATSDAAWLRSRTSRLLDLVEEDETLVSKAPDLNDGERNSRIDPPAPSVLDISTQTEAQLTTEIFPDETLKGPKLERAELDSSRLFIRNLPYTTTEKDLREFFDSYDYGSIEEVRLSMNRQTGTGNGYAYVAYMQPEAARCALNDLSGTSFQGRVLHIAPAAQRKLGGLDEFAVSKLPHKKQQHIKRKAEAAFSTFNWNAMFMNADAVLSSVSDRLGVAKSSLIDASSSDAAVKQAHAETHNIQATKAYFSANGVNLDAFGNSDRGDTGILVKNFSYQTKASELRELFESYGPLSGLLVPPSGTIAIVEFKDRNHARSAFAGLAYRKVKNSILFLEKAPKNLFLEAEPRPDDGKAANPSSRIMVREDANSNRQVDSSTLFVRNLSFSTTTDRLHEVFRPLEGFLSARVKMKPNPKKQGQLLSMGFGFLEFSTKHQAQVALKAMDCFNLDGHQIHLQVSRKDVDVAEGRRKEDSAKKAMGRKTKIIIKNLPFEASKKQVRSLFSPYGQLRSIRLPKKFDSSSRGFAFAEFITAKEAENAMDSLKDTHLLGRKLVLDFTAEDAMNSQQEVADIQRRVGKQADKVALRNLTSTNRRKFNVNDEN